MADKTMGAQDFLMFQTLLNQVGPRSYANQALYGMFPKTAAAAAGMPMAGYGAIPLSKSALSTGAAGVARMGATRLPLAQGILQTLGGDPIGGVGTAGGGYLGAKAGAAIGTAIAPGIGTLAGGLIGGLAGGSAGQSLTRGLAGIDVNNPLTGPDISIPIFGGIPLSQYAKTKKSLERATELEKKRYKELAPLYEEARNRQMARDMIGSQMGLASTMLGSVYGR